MNIKRSMDEIRTRLLSIREEATAIIKERDKLEHPGIERLGPRAMRVQFKDLDPNNWSAEYHDWPLQCERIIKILEQRKPEELDKVLESIFDTKRYAHENLKFHPELLARIQVSLGMITEKQRKDYVAGEYNGCPICGDYGIEGGPVEIDCNSAWQQCSCGKCEATWNDIYTLSDVELKEV
jgi:hypothetical protein